MGKKKFAPTDDWIIQMFEFFKDRLSAAGLEKYKIHDSDVISTVFMAWAPWAWKTEFIESTFNIESYIILDADNYRCHFVWYNWTNAYLFQQPVSRVMDKMFSFCMKNQLRIIVDGTFWNKKIITQNLDQCTIRKREAIIVLVYQDPIISYLYTKLREIDKKRSVPSEDFINKFFSSIENVRNVLESYHQFPVFITVKDIKGKKHYKERNINNKKDFDSFLRPLYNRNEIEQKIWAINQKIVETQDKKGFIRTIISFLS